jgi:hypothetical protein
MASTAYSRTACTAPATPGNEGKCSFYTQDKSTRAPQELPVKGLHAQTYFIGHGRVHYFVVTDDQEKGGMSIRVRNSVLLTQLKKELFKKLEKDYKDWKMSS